MSGYHTINIAYVETRLEAIEELLQKLVQLAQEAEDREALKDKESREAARDVAKVYAKLTRRKT